MQIKNKFLLFAEAGGNNEGAAGGTGDGAANSGSNNAGASGGLFDDTGSGKGGDGAGDGKGKSGSGNSSNDTKQGQGGSGVNIPENWKDALSEDLKSMPSLAKIKDIPSLVKSYAHLEKMLGSEKIPVPQKGATLEQLKDYFQKAGLPSDEAEYKFDIQAKNVEEDFLKAFKSEAYKLNVLPAQAKGIVEWFAKVNEEIYTKEVESQQLLMKEGMDSLRKEWGAAYNEELSKAKAALREFTDPEQQEYIKKQGLGYDPVFIKLMAKVGSTLAEDKIRGEGGTGKSIYTPEQAKVRIGEIKANVRGPYYDKSHAEHEAIKREVAALYSMAYPGTQTNIRENA